MKKTSIYFVDTSVSFNHFHDFRRKYFVKNLCGRLCICVLLNLIFSSPVEMYRESNNIALPLALALG